jgi:hypothetical protein
MSWVITGSQKTDPDALAYLAEVERADGQALESGVRDAVIAFVVGCKADGIWNAIKASCILAGARTLSGALIPLVGTTPTNNNFVSGDYNRKTGLVGNGTTKYLNSNRNNNNDPQNSFHLSVYVDAIVNTAAGQFPIFAGAGANGTAGSSFIGLDASSAGSIHLNRTQSVAFSTGVRSAGLNGVARNTGSAYTFRAGTSSSSITAASQSQLNSNVFIYATNNSGTPFGYYSGRISFYSMGEFLDLSLLGPRVTTLINSFASAIP